VGFVLYAASILATVARREREGGDPADDE
jgi:hypothetical protein